MQAPGSILVVDDRESNRHLMKEILENAGHRVACASDGAQAIDLAITTQPDVILLDVKMPGMDGFEVAELLRKRERTRHTPIVFISAFDQTVFQMKKGYIVGATDFIFSPVDAELLKFKVATYVHIYLRNEAIRAQLRDLELTVASLREEVRTRGIADPALQTKIRSFEAIIDGFKRQMEMATP